MYNEYFGLKDTPFSIAPDPRFLYRSLGHREALARLVYSIEEQMGAAMLTGDYGSGKTILSRVLLEELNAEHYQTVLIFNPRMEFVELLQEVIYQHVLEKNLGVMDTAAISLCRDNDIPIIVFRLMKPGNIRRVVCGEKVGSVVH